MKVQVKLMASLRGKLPPDARKGVAEMELAPETTVAMLLEKLDIPSSHIHLVMVNDEMETDRQRPLADGDSLTIFPPVAGGGV